MSYTVYRNYFDDANHPREVFAEGLTLEEAREICSDPETDSRTCEEHENIARTVRCGKWFCGYDGDGND